MKLPKFLRVDDRFFHLNWGSVVPLWMSIVILVAACAALILALLVLRSV